MKPVAWIDYIEDSNLYDLNVSGRGVPLYTAPQLKELSDEEIMKIFTAYEQMQEYGYVGKKPFKVSLGWSLSERNDCLMLAKAILKKASEK
jgi:hypothetical protein